MWSATITRKDFDNGLLRVIVVFSDGVRSCEETYNLRRGPELDSFIKSRLIELNALDTFASSLSIGAYTPQIDVAAPPNPLTTALRELREVHELVSIGVLKDTDQEVIDALTAAKIEYNK